MAHKYDVYCNECGLIGRTWGGDTSWLSMAHLREKHPEAYHEIKDAEQAVREANKRVWDKFFRKGEPRV